MCILTWLSKRSCWLMVSSIRDWWARGRALFTWIIKKRLRNRFKNRFKDKIMRHWSISIANYCKHNKKFNPKIVIILSKRTPSIKGKRKEINVNAVYNLRILQAKRLFAKIVAIVNLFWGSNFRDQILKKNHRISNRLTPNNNWNLWLKGL